MKRPCYYTMLFVFCLSFYTDAQVSFSESFSNSLDHMEVDLAIPTEQSYKNRRIRTNEYFPSNYAMRSRKNKIEIHFALVQEQEFLIPNVQTTSIISTLASNEEAYATIAIHKIEEKELSESFNADWGNVAYFQPKRSFSKYQHGKLLSLYKAGKGMIHVLYLFDVANEEIDNQLYLARFKTLINQ